MNKLGIVNNMIRACATADPKDLDRATNYEVSKVESKSSPAPSLPGNKI